MRSFLTISFLAFSLLISGFSLTASGQTVYFKDGSSLQSLGLRRSGDILYVKVKIGSGIGEVAKSLTTIASIDFPKPSAFAQTRTLLAAGKAAEALQTINAQVAYFEPFQHISGNFWSDAVLLKISALLALGRNAEATILTNQLAVISKDPDILSAVKLKMAESQARGGNRTAAETIYRDTIKTSKKPEILAQAWVDLGDTLYTDTDYRHAVTAYLHIPVFYSQETLFMPRALLGAAKSLIKIHDKQNAESYLHQLIKQFPNSQEKAEAQKTIQNLN